MVECANILWKEVAYFYYGLEDGVGMVVLNYVTFNVKLEFSCFGLSSKSFSTLPITFSMSSISIKKCSFSLKKCGSIRVW